MREKGTGKNGIYDCLVVGSGIAGMTAALLLAKAGRKVLVVEKADVPGGSMRRFRREGVPYDTGFHFTRAPEGCFGNMIRELGWDDLIEAVPVPVKIVLTDTGKEYPLPRGRNAVEAYLRGIFPESAEGIKAYFRKEKEISDATPTPGSERLFEGPDENDFNTLGDFLDSLKLEPEAKLILGSFVTCHGTPAYETSLSGHCRVSFGLMDNLVRIRGGGDPFIRGFLREAEKYGIEIRTGCEIVRCENATRAKCTEALLSDGSTISFSKCVMTIHPAAIAKILPERVQTDAFRERITAERETCGFFTLYGTVDGEGPFREGLTSCFPSAELRGLVEPETPEKSVTGIMCSVETDSKGTPRNTVTLFRSMFSDEVAEWRDSHTGSRPPEYLAYKKRKSAELEELLMRTHPEFRGRFHPAGSASMLTFRDYLSPFGSAYGIRRRAGEIPFFGKLPIRNFYVCGQNSLLPGAMGAMLSAFLIAGIITGGTAK